MIAHHGREVIKLIIQEWDKQQLTEIIDLVDKIKDSNKLIIGKLACPKKSSIGKTWLIFAKMLIQMNLQSKKIDDWINFALNKTVEETKEATSKHGKNLENKTLQKQLNSSNG